MPNGRKPQKKTSKTASEALKLAVEIAGGFAGLGRLCGVSREAVRKWKQLPPEHVILVSARYRIPRGELRPDLYPS